MPMAYHFSFLVIILSLFPWQSSHAQWSLSKGDNDSLNCLILRVNADGVSIDECRESQWSLPYPVYQLQTGDVDGDGNIDALVGVVKPTRFFPEPARRLFVFKNHHGHIRPMWMGSKLGGILEDFRWTGDALRSLERTTDNRFFVCEYTWNGFGFSFLRFVIENATKEEALPFLQP